MSFASTASSIVTKASRSGTFQHQVVAPATTIRSIGASTGTNYVSEIQEPNRLTSIYQRMKQECPDDLKAYAACVAAANNSDDELGLQQGLCQSQFGKVQQCFQRTREYTFVSNTQKKSPHYAKIEF